ncbi:histidine kinase [uncultured Chitinophaga sp.]|jgi:Histidine kinase./Histidine kinase-, DNA gyrase B-, and HSP90-like ATPase.|uniref:sensor histidine kinase n=1 Tax=uncultured Chitinophaga sp. TaxID=339340 RepID=UPI00262D934D|nr:histidine kinase [uncultured Chitinophaga sp.]
MQDPQSQIVVIIIAITIVLLFIGILFLVMIWSYNNKKLQMAREKQQIQDAFEKQLLQSRLEIQEATLNAVSQEIHDNVGQLLSYAKVQLNIMEQQATWGQEELHAIKDTIGTAFTALRNIARSLNILKHAAATRVQIDMLYLPEQLQINIHDNGKGFNVATALTNKEGLGLQNILNRARLMGGAATIISQPEEGTSIKINVPYA